jgi:hypothetical protein
MESTLRAVVLNGEVGLSYPAVARGGAFTYVVDEKFCVHGYAQAAQEVCRMMTVQSSRGGREFSEAVSLGEEKGPNVPATG